MLPPLKRPRLLLHGLRRLEDEGFEQAACNADGARTISLSGSSPAAAVAMLQRMQDMPELCDMTLRVRDEDGNWTSLRAHRLVLAAASKELRAMLLGGFCEGSQEEVTLKDVPAWATRALLDFVYTGRTVVRVERLLEMARAADFVGLLELRAMCVARAVSGLEVANAADVLMAADTMGLTDLKEQSTKLILRDYSKVVQTSGFASLSRALMQELLASDDLRVRKEEEVLESLTSWLNVDPSRCAEDSEHLYPLVRFPLMSPQYLLARVEHNEVMKRCACLAPLLQEAKNHMLLTLCPAQNLTSMLGLQPQSSRTRPRIEFGDLLVEGPQPGEPQADCMGVYELQDWLINGRPVYQQQGDTDLYLYYASTEKWYISDGEDMRSGRPRGWCQVTSQAMAPDKIQEEWTVWDTPMKSWEAAPGMKCYAMNAAIRRELAARQQVQEAEARRQAQQVGDIVIEGQQPGDLQHDCMGTYELQDQVVNGRPVYRQQGGMDMYLFYASRGSKWCISDGEDMCAGRPKGWCYVVSQALTPDQIVEQWEVVADDGGQEAHWQPAARFRARPVIRRI